MKECPICKCTVRKGAIFCGTPITCLPRPPYAVFRRLIHANIFTVEKLKSLSETEILKIPGLGPDSLKWIRRMLKDYSG